MKNCCKEVRIATEKECSTSIWENTLSAIGLITVLSLIVYGLVTTIVFFVNLNEHIKQGHVQVQTQIQTQIVVDCDKEQEESYTVDFNGFDSAGTAEDLND